MACVTQEGALQQARYNDLATCPLCMPPTGLIRYMLCHKTYVNNRLVSVCGDGITCGAKTLGCSATVYFENHPAHRFSNFNSCGGVTVSASPDTYTGG